MEQCDEIVEAMKGLSLPEITLEDLGKKSTMTAVEAALIIKALLREFGIDDDRVVRAYNAYLKTYSNSVPEADGIDRAICGYVAEHRRENYASLRSPSLFLSLFNDLLTMCTGFSTDWKYSEEDVEWWMNKEHLLRRYGLKISFSPHEWNEPFDILVHDLNTGALVGKETFHYSGKYHEMRELIGVVNKLIEDRGLIFVDADEGGDSFAFMLFEAAELERLNKKYGDIGSLINLSLRIDNIRSDVIVLVSSRGGNTRKVADAIAKEAGVKVGDVSLMSLHGVKLAFLGSGTYGGKPGEDVANFIRCSQLAGIKVAVFGTSNFSRSGQKMVDSTAELLKQNSAIVPGSFHCRGKTAIFNKDRPNQEDLDNAKRFAREMMKIIS